MQPGQEGPPPDTDVSVQVEGEKEQRKEYYMERTLPEIRLQEPPKRMDWESKDPTRVQDLGDLEESCSTGAGRFGWIDERVGISPMGGKCPICSKSIHGDLKAWISHFAAKQDGRHNFMDTSLRGMIRGEEERSRCGAIERWL